MKRYFFLIFILTATFNNLKSQTLEGQELVGVDAQDRFGSTVSLGDNGRFMAVGARFQENEGVEVGAVTLYENVSGTWTQYGDVIYGEGFEDQFGDALEMSEDGNFFIVGALLNDAEADNAGMVKVYQRTAQGWDQEGQTLYGESNSDLFGDTVAINDDGSLIAVGTNQFGNDNGIVKVYSNINGVWTQQGEDLIGLEPNERFGAIINFNDEGSMMSISAPFNDMNGNNSGYVKVFAYTDSQWEQYGQTLIDDTNGFVFGVSNSLSGDGNTLAVGVLEGDGENDRGAVKIYRMENQIWTQVGNTITGDQNFGNNTGVSLSISSNGNIVAVGDVGNYENGNDSGETRLFQLLYNTWTQVSDGINGEELSQSATDIDINDTGDLVVIGAPLSNINGENSGKVSAYSYIVNTFPIANCQNATLFLDENGMAILDVAQIENGSSDNESENLIFSLSEDTFGCENLGENEVTLFVDDGFGLISECISIITVIDEIPPSINCESLIVIETEEAFINLPDYSNLIADNCGDENITITQSPVPNTVINSNSSIVVELSATDASGNFNSCNFEVQVDQVLGLEEVKEKALLIYPNPTHDTVRVALKNNTIRNVKLYSALGQLVNEISYNTLNTEAILDMSLLKNGIYFISITNNNGNLTTNYIIKR